jgi:hypothetical protein
MRARKTFGYSRDAVANLGGYVPDEKRGPDLRANNGGRKSKVKIRRRKPEPLIWEELFSLKGVA